MNCVTCGNIMEKKYFFSIPNRDTDCCINICWACGNREWSYHSRTSGAELVPAM